MFYRLVNWVRKVLGKKILRLILIVVRDMRASVPCGGQPGASGMVSFSILTYCEGAFGSWSCSVSSLCSGVTWLRCGPHPCPRARPSPRLRQTVLRAESMLTWVSLKAESMLTWVKVTHQIMCIFLMIQAGLHFFNINCLSPRKHYVLCLVIFILIFLSQKKGRGREFLVIVKFIRFFWIEVGVG